MQTGGRHRFLQASGLAWLDLDLEWLDLDLESLDLDLESLDLESLELE